MAVTDPSAFLPDQSTTGLPPSAVRIDPESGTQLGLRFWPIIDRGTGRPAERGLWRDLVSLAIGARGSFQVGARTISASSVWSVALTLYMRANLDGIIAGFSLPVLAADCRLSREVVTAAVALLRGWRVVQMSRAPKGKGKSKGGRRAAAIWRMNLGALDWPAVRARAERERKPTPDRAPTATQLPLDCAPTEHEPTAATPSGDAQSPLSGDAQSPLSGDAQSPLSGDAQSPLKGYVRREDQDLPPNPPKGGQAKATVTRQPEDPAAGAAARDRYLAKLAEVAHGKGMTAQRPPRPSLRRRHIVVAGLAGGGQCAVCGEVRPSRRAACPGPPNENACT